MKIIKIGAMWCPACLIMNKRLKQVESNKHIEIINYDYDLDEDIVEKYKVGQVLPELIFLNENNEEIERLIGEQSIETIEKIIEGSC
ncbi:MAG: thioredoxin family protein [Bacilli bacterium]